MVVRVVIALVALTLIGLSVNAGSWVLFALAVILLCVAVFPRRVYRRPAADRRK
jgi:hypothetical protein